MDQYFSPKQVAQAIGVSESSLKRWCDKGVLDVHKTAGGHRRLALNSVVEFLRQNGQTLLHPELLGLPTSARLSPTLQQTPSEQLAEKLLQGDEIACRHLVVDLYLQGRTAVEILDQVMAPAMRLLGHRWEQKQIEVFQERRACEICLRLLYEFRTLLPRPSVKAPCAIGGTPSQDRFKIATTMVEIALREAGWQAESFGSDLPFPTLRKAIESHRPRLFWLSVTHIEDHTDFIAGCNALAQYATEHNAAFVVGGQALTKSVRAELKYSAFCDNLQHLLTFSKTLWDADSAE